MKRRTLILLAMIVIVLLTSCAKKVETCTVTEKDGVKIYKNKNISTDEKLDFNPVKKFTINNDSTDEGYFTYSDFDLTDVDNQGNIFIADWGRPKIYKYNKDGKFVKTFVKKGKGPGEASNFLFMCIKNDTIYISDKENFSVSMFNTNGDFLKRVQPKGILLQMKPVGKSKFICKLFNYKAVEGKYEATEEITLLNNSLEPIKVLDKKVYIWGEVGLPDTWLYLAVSDDKIYIPVNDGNIYKIKAFDHDGNIVEEIYKDYRSTVFTEKEFEKMEFYLKKTDQGVINRKNMKRKRSIVGIYVDKNQNLITHPAVDTSKGNTEGMLLDFFNKNIYQNSYLLKTEKPYYQCDFDTFINFYGNRMFVYNTERNVLDVYEY